jgi:hypothetical protein
LHKQKGKRNKLCPLQNKIIAPNHRPEIVLDDLGMHVVQGRQGTDPDGSGTKNSLSSSGEGGNTTSLYGLAEIWSIGTPMN